MSGDYTKFSFKRRNRFSALLQQQGRVHLDSDFNEAIEILRERTRVQALDTFGEFGIAQLTTPNAFKIAVIAGPPADLSIEPGRVYVDGWLAEAFADENATYLKQPFLPDPPALPAGDAVIYLDVHQRELTCIEHPPLLDPGLLGVDTTTRLQTVWQLRVDAHPGAVCGLPVGKPPSAARLTTEAVAPPTPDDPCILPPIAGYRGLENRLYRIEIHDGGALGTARFKWSRDNGSIVSSVTNMAVAGGQTTLTVNRIGRDQFMRFAIDNWVTVTDDVRELMDEPGEMARVIDIDESNNRIVLDRALPSLGARAFGATANDIVARHTRVQRWDQSAATNVVDADGLIATGPGPIDIEAGIRVRFDVDPAGGLMHGADFWAFWARTATASIEILNKAPPRGIHHHYVQLTAATGLGGPAPVVTPCRPGPLPVPPPGHDEPCCCTFVVAVGEDIQKAIDSLPDAGGCVCLKTGIHLIPTTLVIARSHVKLVGESPGTIVRATGEAAALVIDGRKGLVEGVEVATISFEIERIGNLPGVITIINARRSSIVDCSAAASEPRRAMGIAMASATELRVARCIITTVEVGILVTGTLTGEVWLEDNLLELSSGNNNEPPAVGIVVQGITAACRIERNIVIGAIFGIVVNDTLIGVPQSAAAATVVRENKIACVAQLPALGAAEPAFGIDIACDSSVVAENAVVMRATLSQAPTGIRVTGVGVQCTDNDIRIVSASTGKPVGLEIGFSDGTTATPTQAIVVRGNQIAGAPVGIAATDTTQVLVDGNTIEMSGRLAAITKGDLGISLVRSSRCVVRDNVVSRMAISVASDTGLANHVAGNILANGGVGVLLQKESGPIVAQNRISNMTGSAVSLSGSGRFDVVGNRITNCAFGADFGVAIGALSILGELHVEANEVMDTGLSPDGTLKASIAYGIGASLILEARVESNLVTYSNATSRSPSAEDRALSMMGLIEVDTPQGAPNPVAGFAVQIIGNKFLGWGKSALVQLTQQQLSDTVLNRFERVLFHNNHCMHLTEPSFISDTVATVVLVGHAASVVGNHIKATTRAFPSIDFNEMPGPCIGNVLTGPIRRQGTSPALDSNFNMTIF